MEIGSVGYNYSHDSEFIMDRPNGIGCWLFLIVKTPALFVIDGQEHIVKESSFVIFTPETPCSYRALNDTYTDDWMYFSADEDDINFFKEHEIPLNRAVWLGNTDELSRLMHIIAYEHYSADMYNNEIERHYSDILFLKLSRIIRTKAYSFTEAHMERNYRFTQLRSMIYTMPDKVPDIDGMAEQMNMSRSGFQHLYKKIFGTGVINDVINGRLDRAKRLLSSTNLTVREIAERCGYSNEYNFMRQFKSRFGKTPTEYRRIM